MSKLQVLVTTMHQTDFSKYDEMNLQTDAVIANQADSAEVQLMRRSGCEVQLITTPSRGVSRNRNIALAYANQQTEYTLFADDDLILNDHYETVIIEEFNRHPEAEAIKFNLHDISSKRKISMRRIEKFEKATRRNMASSGVWGLVIRTDAIRKHNLRFHENFGPGTDDYCGEDTIFLMDMIDKKVKFFRSPIDIAGVDQTKSSWFQGYNEKYFITTGKLFKTMYPKLAYLLAIRSAYRFSKNQRCNMKFKNILKCYVNGIKSK